MVSKGKKELMIFQKRILGLLGFFLAPCAIGFGLLGDNSAIVDPKWWYSISMTYYANSQICMIGVLFAMSVMFLSYVGYNTSDRILTIISGVCAMGIIVFLSVVRHFLLMVLLPLTLRFIMRDLKI